MHRLLWCALAVVCLRAADVDPRVDRLYRTFMAPCCWRENLAVHQSPAADELRREIQTMIAAGATDERIREDLVARHTARILAMPEGSKGAWLSWTPWGFAAAGVSGIAWWIRRSVKSRPAAAAAVPGGAAVVSEEDLEW